MADPAIKRTLPLSVAIGDESVAKLTIEQLRFEDGDFEDQRVIELLLTHVRVATSETAVGSGHALDLSGLQASDITLWTAWEKDTCWGAARLSGLRLTMERSNPCIRFNPNEDAAWLGTC